MHPAEPGEISAVAGLIFPKSLAIVNSRALAERRLCLSGGRGISLIAASAPSFLCEGRKSLAETNPEAVALAKALGRKRSR